MKSFNVSTTLVNRLNSALGSGAYMFWLPEENHDNLVAEGDVDPWEDLYRDSYGFSMVVANKTPSGELRIDYSTKAFSSVVKGYKDFEDYVAIIPDEIKLIPQGGGSKYFRNETNLPSLVKAMLGGSGVELQKDVVSEVRLVIPKGIHIKGIDFNSNFFGFKKLEYLEGTEWVLASDLVNGIVPFETVEATHWRLRLEAPKSSGYISLGKFLLIVDTDKSVVSFPDKKLGGTRTVLHNEGSKSLGLGVSWTTEGLRAITTSAGDYLSDKDVLFKHNVFKFGERPLLVKFEIEFGGFGNDKI